MSYFKGSDGKRYEFADLGAKIREQHPHLIGAHIFEQLGALNLRREMERGHTPVMLPYSFTD